MGFDLGTSGRKVDPLQRTVKNRQVVDIFISFTRQSKHRGTNARIDEKAGGRSPSNVIRRRHIEISVRVATR